MQNLHFPQVFAPNLPPPFSIVSSPLSSPSCLISFLVVVLPPGLLPPPKLALVLCVKLWRHFREEGPLWWAGVDGPCLFSVEEALSV